MIVKIIILANVLRLLIRIRSENRPKGVKLRFGYDHIAPSGLAMPIKWVSTTMFSLVRIRPMFEQKAPKWPKSCLMTLIRIWSMSDPKGLSYDSNMIKKPPSGFGSVPIRVGIDIYVLFGSNTTYVWTRSHQVIMARFRYDHKPDQRESRIQIWPAPCWLFPPPDKEDT